MANEIFNALPEEQQHLAVTTARTVLPPNSAFSGNPFAEPPSPTAPAVPGILTPLSEALTGNYVATPERNIAPDARSSASAIPAVPGGGVSPAAAPEFAFLQDARPLFQEPAAEPVARTTPAQASERRVPSDEGFAAIPSSLLPDPPSLQTAQPPSPTTPPALGVVDSSAIPTFSFLEEARPLFSEQPSLPGPVPAGAPSVNPFAAPLDKNAPQIAGTVAHKPDFRAPASYDPEKQPRPLDPSNIVPVVVPGAGQSELLGDLGLSSTSFEVEAIRRDFPILSEKVNGYPLIWFDNGATTQKPKSVIDRLTYFWSVLSSLCLMRRSPRRNCWIASRCWPSCSGGE
jgi:cysteine desulfurase/selenocysteine lyase